MSQYSVLIVDDDVWMQRILSKTLQSYGFKKSYLASNAFEGIAKAVENQPTLIILDILMPELSGHLALKILKHINATKDIPVLMVSALSDVENLGMAVKSGTAGFISKPFTSATIYEKLIAIFGKVKLDQITRGEDAIESGEIDKDLLSTNSKSSGSSDSDKSDHVKSKIDKMKSGSQNKDDSKKSVSEEKLLQKYQDEERKNIESIKKLLTKSRKK